MPHHRHRRHRHDHAASSLALLPGLLARIELGAMPLVGVLLAVTYTSTVRLIV